MDLEVHIVAGLSAGWSGPRAGRLRVSLSEEANGEDLLEALGVPPDGTVLLIVNGRRTGLHTRLASEDQISVLPPLGGG